MNTIDQQAAKFADRVVEEFRKVQQVETLIGGLSEEDEAEAERLVGQSLVLKELPDGHVSSGYKLTIGKIYKILDVVGSNFHVRTDDGKLASFNMHRFEWPGERAAEGKDNYPKAKPGETVYVQADPDFGGFGIFGDDSGHCYGNYGSERVAKERAAERNASAKKSS